MLELKHITKDYPAGDGTVHALKGVSLQFRESDFVAILGPSGCGKTTMLNIIGGLDQYTGGDLIINGRSTKDFVDRDWDGYRNHSIGFVFQSYNLIPHQTVLQNVELALTLSGVSKSERKQRAVKALQEYARNHDLSNPKHYDYICSQINMDNYIDYMITQMWIANTDLGNVKFFRTDDMPWHWALFDADLSFRRVSHTSVTIMMTRNIYKRDIRSATLLIRLMENKTFKDTFLKRTAWVVNNVWNAENVIRRIDEIQSLLEPDMKRECSRWGSSVDTWKKNVQSLRNFADKRNDYFIADVKSYFHLSDAQMRSYGFEV